MRGATRGSWNDEWASPIALSLSKGQRRKACKAEAANEGGAGESEPDMLGSVAAE
jgi:hypothetical protein